MVRCDAELATIEEHFMACSQCAELAEETADTVDLIRAPIVAGNFDLELYGKPISRFADEAKQATAYPKCLRRKSVESGSITLIGHDTRSEPVWNHRRHRFPGSDGVDGKSEAPVDAGIGSEAMTADSQRF